MTHDPFASSRLPDLPNAGYATRREREASDLIMQFIRQMERDRICLLDIVSSGRLKWRKVCNKALRGARLDTELIDAIYDYLGLLAGPHPIQQLHALLELKAAPPWMRQQEYRSPEEATKRVRDALSFNDALKLGNRRLSELVRIK